METEVEEEADGQRNNFSNGIGPPDKIAVAAVLTDEGQHEGGGNQEDQLADKRDQHGVNGLTGSLKGTAQRNADGGDGEAEGDDAQRGATHGDQRIGGVEQAQQELLLRVWGSQNSAAQTRTVAVTLTRLREKIGAAPSACIETIRGRGYRWNQS